MSEVLAPPRSVRPRQGSGVRSGVWSLARTEGNRLIRHPIFVVGALLSLAAFEFATWLEAPVLHRDDVMTAGSLLGLAGATFLAANLGALRTRRLGTEELFGATPTGPDARTLGHLLSVAWAAGAAMLVALLEIATLLPFQPVGVPSVLELAVGPLIVALFGVLGVLVARWIPSVAIAPVALVALGGIQLYLLTQLPGGNDHQSRARWLAPWVPLSAGGLGTEPPPELVVRPTGWHVLYLLALAVALGALTLARRGVRGRPAAVLAAGLGVAMMAGVLQVRPPSLAERDRLVSLATRPEAFQVCKTQGGIRYCAYPAYSPWIDRWEAPVAAVLDEVPVEDRPRFTVRQRFTNTWASNLPDRAGPLLDAMERNSEAITPGTHWGRNGTLGSNEFSLALLVSSWSVGLPRNAADFELTPRDIRRLVRQVAPSERGDYRAMLLSEGYPQCSLLGQGRAAVALWLAGHATPGAARTLRDVVATEGTDFVNYGGGVYWTGPRLYALSDYSSSLSTSIFVTWPREAAHYAVQLLDREAADVSSVLASSWEALVDPQTPMAAVVDLFGLRPYPTIEQQLSGFDEGTRERLRREVEGSEELWEPPCR